jgi:hypothetical protein
MQLIKIYSSYDKTLLDTVTISLKTDSSWFCAGRSLSSVDKTAGRPTFNVCTITKNIFLKYL